MVTEAGSGGARNRSRARSSATIVPEAEDFGAGASAHDEAIATDGDEPTATEGDEPTAAESDGAIAIDGDEPTAADGDELVADESDGAIAARGEDMAFLNNSGSAELTEQLADSPLPDEGGAIADAPPPAVADDLDDMLLAQLDGMHGEDTDLAPETVSYDPAAEDDEQEAADQEAADSDPATGAPPAPRSEVSAASPRVSASGWFALESDGRIQGWCLDRGNVQQRMTVAISIDGEVVGTALADRLQPRLQQQGEGDGCFAFSFTIPFEFRDDAEHVTTVEIVTPAYDGTRLKTKAPTFSLSPDSAIPAVSLRQASIDGIEGVLSGGAGLREELDVWLDGVRLGEDDISVEWLWGEQDMLPFRVRLANHPLLPLLTSSLSICYPGTREGLGAGAMLADLLAVEVNPLGGNDYEIVLGPEVSLPDGMVVRARIFVDEPNGPMIAHYDLELANGATWFTLENTDHDRMLLRLAGPGDEPLGPDLRFSYAYLSRRMLPNGAFEHWGMSGPADFVIPDGISWERGFYAFPAAIKNQYLLSGKTLSVTLDPDGAERVVLRRALPRSLNLGLEAVQIGIGFFMRASRPASIVLRLTDETGVATELFAGVVSTRWKSDWRPVTFDRSGSAASPLDFEIAVRPLGDDGEPTFVEFGGLHLGETDVATFADALEPPKRRDYFAAGDNLVVNAALVNWPSGLSFSDRRSRFEIADGWNIFNRRSSSEIKVAAVPAPRGETGRYALSITVAQVPEYCRLEVLLDCRDVAGRGELSFQARRDDLPTPEGQTYVPERWSYIDRIYLLKRETREDGGKLVATDTVIANIARRVVVTRSWEDIRFDFAPAETETDFDLAHEFARDDGGLVEYLLIYEFRRPIALQIHGVSVRFQSKPAPPDEVPLRMEDKNIRTQVGTVRGIDDWNARTVQRPAVHPAPAGATTTERWSWKHTAMGMVDVGICVYNAADETMECLQSLVGASGVPHIVRIINDGSDEDCRQRIADFIRDKPWMTLVDNDGNKGYTHSANRAVLETSADWVILLNSDTIVSKGWIEGLLEVAASDPQTAFVGAVSNAATYQSVPELYDGAGKWAVNELPKGYAPSDLAAFVAAHSGRHFPAAPLLNGFCTLINRAIFAEVGGLNEQAFPAGYGEENDLCLRVRKAGYTLRIADHVYVYHSKSASFGTARRTELAKAGDKALRAIHQDVDLAALGRDFLETPALVELRQTVRSAFALTQPVSPGSSHEEAH